MTGRATDRLDASFLDTALGYASQEARNHVADSLSCYLHNDGYTLQGNTEANDVEWFARTLWAEDMQSVPGQWERASNQETYRRYARAVIRVLPDFQLRIADRLIALSKVVRDIGRAERKQLAALTRRQNS